MRTLALALLLAVSGSVAALAQQDRSYYSDRDYQWRRDHPNEYYDQRDRYSEQRSNQDRRDAERWREQEAYDRGRQEAERNQQNNGQNDIVNSIGRMFNNR
jgi:hypothetical protein